MKEIILGAVAYDAKVVPIWDGFRNWFRARGLPVDYILFTNYERQVDAHLRGELDVAWNSPLAWLHTERKAREVGRTAKAIAMRDSDRDLTSVVVVRADSPIRSVADLRGANIGVGAADSPQATLIPLLSIAEAGIEPGRDVEVVRHDVLLGKHGDHIGGERDAIKALLGSTVDAACILDANRLAFSREGLLAPNATRVVHQTALYDHCNMTVIDDSHAKSRTSDAVGGSGGAHPNLGTFAELLRSMSYDDPVARPLLDMEGLKQWLPGRTSGYGLLDRAIERFMPIPAWLGG